MSYCRWSSDDFQSDVYVYEDCRGPWVVHVAGRRHVISLSGLPEVPDREVVGKKAKRVIACSGKLYYELAAKRKAEGRDDVAIVRFEQLYPLRADELREVFSAYAEGTDLVWCQEEPWNSGAWYFMNARLPTILEHRFPLRCVSRVESASPATGSPEAHKLEQKQLIEEAFETSGRKSQRPSARPRANGN